MHELVPHTRVEGNILFYGEDLYAPGSIQPLSAAGSEWFSRNRIHFPTMSIEENVIVGLALERMRNRQVAEGTDSKSRCAWRRFGTK